MDTVGEVNPGSNTGKMRRDPDMYFEFQNDQLIGVYLSISNVLAPYICDREVISGARER
jgi:hypothetical protein